MGRYLYTVAVDTDSVEHADQVLAERLGCDKQYEDEFGVKFGYTVDYRFEAHQ